MTTINRYATRSSVRKTLCEETATSDFKNLIVDCANRRRRSRSRNRVNADESCRTPRRTRAQRNPRSPRAYENSRISEGSCSDDRDPCDPPTDPPQSTNNFCSCICSLILIALLLFGMISLGLLRKIYNYVQVGAIIAYYIYTGYQDFDSGSCLKTEMIGLKDRVQNLQSELQTMLADQLTSEKDVTKMESHVKSYVSESNQNNNYVNLVKGANHLAQEPICVFHRDHLEKNDYALESLGGKVVSTPNTAEYEFATETVTVFGLFPICSRKKRPETMLQPNVEPGECWAFKGSKGSAIIKLISKVRISGISLRHISKTESPAGHIQSAPRDFYVYGMHKPTDSGSCLLGEYTYEQNGPGMQYFPVSNKKCFRYIKLHIASNHGNPNYTCVYHIRVHGDPKDKDK